MFIIYIFFYLIKKYYLLYKMSKVKFQREVKNNGSVDAPMQFNVPHEIDVDKKVKPSQVFKGYSKTSVHKKSDAGKRVIRQRK